MRSLIWIPGPRRSVKTGISESCKRGFWGYDRHSTDAEKPRARAARSGGDTVSVPSEPVRKAMPFASRNDVTIDDFIAKLMFSARSLVIRASLIALIFATTVT